MIDPKQQPQTESRRTELEKLRRELMAEEAVRPAYEEEGEDTIIEEAPEKGEQVVGEPEPSTEQKLMWQEIESKTKNKAIANAYLFYSLPEEIKERLASEKLATAIKTIGEKYGLTQTKISAIASAVKDLYIMKFNLKDFIREIQQRLNTDPDTAKALAKDIANEILAPEKNFLKKLHSS